MLLVVTILESVRKYIDGFRVYVDIRNSLHGKIMVVEIMIFKIIN